MTYPPKKMEGPTAYRDPIAPYNQDYSIWSCACPHIGHKLKPLSDDKAWIVREKNPYKNNPLPMPAKRVDNEDSRGYNMGVRCCRSDG